jgi:hypothetical protein
MSELDSEAFTKIIAPEIKQQIAQDLIKLKAVITCKSAGSEVFFNLEAHQLLKSDTLSCRALVIASIPNPLPEQIIVATQIGQDKYYFNTQIKNLGGGYFELDLNIPFFHLQRRDSYRVQIPESAKCDLKINNSECKILDFSSGGLRFTLPHVQPIYQVEQKVTVVLSFPGKKAMGFEALVRHVKVEQLSKPQQVIGVEFQNITPQMDSYLFALTIDLHRQLRAQASNRS